ncbi:MAG: hypothetical protein O2910_05995 [Proteobacteria bacterium]|jgi:hypothetical protein|nr:hypothetical protein [Pseudomonadota bacterium]
MIELKGTAARMFLLIAAALFAGSGAASAQNDAQRSSEYEACRNAMVSESPAAGSLCEQAARGGARPAMYYLGQMYREGHLVPQNYDMAVYWLDLAMQSQVAVASPALRQVLDGGPKGLPIPGARKFLSLDQAAIVMGLFAEGCAAHFCSPTSLGEWVDRRGFPIIEGESLAYFLNGKEGVGWTASNEAGQFVILFTGQDRACTALAHNADVTAVERQFRALIRALQGQGFRVDQEADSPVALDGRNHVQLAYYVQASGSTNAAGYMLVIAEDDDAPVAARMSATPVAVKD